MSTNLAIDPGPKESAYVLWNGSLVLQCGYVPNADLRAILCNQYHLCDAVAVEMVACYGMPVGREVFETCLEIGRIVQICADCPAGPKPVRLVYRKDVKMHLCHNMKAKDGNIRQALIDKHGAVGTKKKPGPLYGVSGHLWAALAVADYASEVA